MGKNAHPPRGNASSTKKPKPPTNPAEDDSFIVFSNAKGEPKKPKDKTAASSADKGKGKDKKAQDGPKKPTTREIIGGASWTGKLPVTLLSEHCQKQKWDKPEYTMHKDSEGFSSMVILKSKNLKTQEVTTLSPFKLPASHKHLAIQPTALEARHFAATYALFRVCSMRNIHMMMPPQYRDLWKGDFQDLKTEDVAAGLGRKYEADPFQAQRDHEEAQVQKEKKREQRQKDEAARQNQPGGSAPAGQNLAKGWTNAPKVEMGKKLRRDVESLIREFGTWNALHIDFSKESRAALVDQLSNIGFRKSHVEEAAEICKDKEEVLEWLLIHVPEDDLPSWCLPEGYAAGVSMASGNLRREAAVKRLARAGYGLETCEEMFDKAGGDERKAAQALQDSIFSDTNGKLLSNDANKSRHDEPEDESGVWEEEQTVLVSIYEGRFQKIDNLTSQIDLDIPNQQISLHVRKPIKPYPENPPLITLLTPLPSYIRLSIIQKVLHSTITDFIGDQMIFNIVDWLEREIPAIVQNPGRLSDITLFDQATASSQKIEIGNRKKNHKLPTAISRTAKPEKALQMLSEWNAKQQSTPQIKMLQTRQSLPAWKLRKTIPELVSKYPVTIISGETGSGKSTQSVQFILDKMIEQKLGSSVKIICTQPRRISALGLADRVAEERCSAVGQEVGYAIRGESKQSEDTRITFVTTGVLLRRLQTSGGSPEDLVASLADISHVVVDEVHERSLDTDFLLALLRDVLKRRKDLKVILMSATLDADVFANYFGGSSCVGRIEISGRTFPVTDYYIDDVILATGFRKDLSQANEDGNSSMSVAKSLQSLGMGINYELIAALVKHIDLELGSQKGAILIFLPGTLEINRTLDVLRSIPSLHALPLHASLIPAEQRRVFPAAPHGKRKVIASTNVAETSITISDVVAVIDTGRVKETRFDPQASMVKLEEVWASRAACKQRRGRAGRVSEGNCYKLYTRAAEAKFAERPEPEIRRVPLEQLCLSVKAMGLQEVSHFLANTLTPPESLAVEGALNLLRRVGALDGDSLTALGRHMAMIPADLRCAKLMVFGALFGALEPCLTIASILTVRSPFVSPQGKRDESKAVREKFATSQGDVIADLRAFEAWQEMRSSNSFKATRSWCDENFLSSQTLTDISTTRAQYITSLKEIGFLPLSYHSESASASNHSPSPTPSYNRNARCIPLLLSLLLSALHPQTLRISLPTTKYAATVSGTLALDPESRAIKFFDGSNTRVFVHPSSTLFSMQSYGNAGFLSYFNRVETSKIFARELSPCVAYGVLLFGGEIELDTMGRGLVVDGWVRLRGWARIGVLVGRLRRVLDDVLEKWVEDPRSAGRMGGVEERVVDVVRRLVEFDGMDR